MSGASYWYYLDASALVRLVVTEPGSNDVREYFDNNAGACTTFISFVEALGVLKRKWYGKWDDPSYHNAVEQLQIPVYGEKLEIDDTTFANPQTFKKVSTLAQSYTLDFADALQLFAIKNGKYSPFAAESSTRFVSADRDLVLAAREFKILTWECSKNGSPQWV